MNGEPMPGGEGVGPTEDTVGQYIPEINRAEVDEFKQRIEQTTGWTEEKYSTKMLHDFEQGRKEIPGIVHALFSIHYYLDQIERRKSSERQAISTGTPKQQVEWRAAFAKQDHQKEADIQKHNNIYVYTGKFCGSLFNCKLSENDVQTIFQFLGVYNEPARQDFWRGQGILQGRQPSDESETEEGDHRVSYFHTHIPCITVGKRGDIRTAYGWENKDPIYRITFEGEKFQ